VCTAIADEVPDLAFGRLDRELHRDHPVRPLQELHQPGLQVRDVARSIVKLILRDVKRIQVLAVAGSCRLGLFRFAHSSFDPSKSVGLPVLSE
jgi:hypothetical protein